MSITPKAPNLIIDPVNIFRDDDQKRTIPNGPWYTPGGRLLLVPTICTYGSSLGINQLNLFYIPNTVNISRSYLSLRGPRLDINSSGYSTSGIMHQHYYLLLLTLNRKEMLGNKNLAWFVAPITKAFSKLPKTIKAQAEVG